MKTILIIEDDLLLLKAFELGLERLGFKVLYALDGREGIQKIESELFDLVITGLILPFNHGFEIVNKVKQLKGSDFPVIILDKVKNSSMIEEAYRIGVNKYFTKPFRPGELIESIHEIFSNTKK